MTTFSVVGSRGRGRVAELFAAAVALVVLILVDMTQSRDCNDLGLAADGAGVGLLAGLGAGGRLGDLAVIPLVSFARVLQLVELRHDLRELGTRCVVLREELAVGAADDLVGDGPVKGSLCIGSDAAGVREVLQVVFRNLLAHRRRARSS